MITNFRPARAELRQPGLRFLDVVYIGHVFFIDDDPFPDNRYCRTAEWLPCYGSGKEPGGTRDPAANSYPIIRGMADVPVRLGDHLGLERRGIPVRAIERIPAVVFQAGAEMQLVPILNLFVAVIGPNEVLTGNRNASTFVWSASLRRAMRFLVDRVPGIHVRARSPGEPNLLATIPQS